MKIATYEEITKFTTPNRPLIFSNLHLNLGFNGQNDLLFQLSDTSNSFQITLLPYERNCRFSYYESGSYEYDRAYDLAGKLLVKM
jgi:hypothetical protein